MADEQRYGVGLAMPFGFASSDLKQATDTRLLEMDLTLEVGTKKGELPYDMHRGSRLHLLKHTKIGRTASASMAGHLMQEAMGADKRIRVGTTTTEGSGGELQVSTGYKERGYDGTGGEGTIDYEVPS